MKPKNTDKYGRNTEGKFTKGNPGKPKGSTHKTTKELRESIVHFLLDKSDLMYEIWDTLEPKDQATLFLHLSKLVMPATPTQAEQVTPMPVPRIIMPEMERYTPPPPEDLNQ